MGPLQSAHPSVARLLASWLSFTRWTFSTCAGRAQELMEGGADRVKDTIMDLGCPPPANAAAAGPLPLLETAPFAAALREEIDRTLARMLEVVNGEPGGDWSPRTQEEVLALFHELGETALECALELRVRAAEKEPPAAKWVRKYRRMMAEEGRWPPAGVGEQENKKLDIEK
jgi:hypothetical protein